jgi:hypothetical protein
MLRGSWTFDSWVHDWSTPAPTTYQGSEELAFQRWFKFKEAFSPALVKQVIESMPERPRRVMDCFGGSGTTGVVARLLGIDATLIEVNPFLADLIEAKLSDYRSFDLPLEASRLLVSIDRQEAPLKELRERLPPTFIEPGVNERWLYWKGAAKEIERIRCAVEQVKSQTLRRLFRIALASCLVEASNVRIDGKARRYRGNWQNRYVTARDVRGLFSVALQKIIEDVSRFPDEGKHQQVVMRGDARRLTAELKREYDLAMFSPPYPNSFDYTDIYNIELWVLGYLGSTGDNLKLRHETLRSHVQVKWTAPSFELKSATLEKTYKALEAKRERLWDPRLPEMVVAYFEDMNTILANSRKCLRADGHVAIVVGNSSYADVTIDSSMILNELGKASGLKLKSSESVRVMRSSMQQTRGDKVLDEWLMIFETM